MVFGGQSQVHVVRNQPQELPAERSLVRIVDVGTVSNVCAVAAAIEFPDCNARLEPVGQGAAERPLELDGVVVAECQASVSRRLFSRLVRDDVDGAAGGIAAVQRALRTPQDFDSLDVEQRPELR